MRKLGEIRAARGYSYRIEVDGGVGMDTCASGSRRGGDSGGGNAVFGKGDARRNAAALLDAARSAEFAEGVGKVRG